MTESHAQLPTELAPLAATPAQFHQLADALVAGHGPFAIDTERASRFRYDDRAYLIQIHRAGAGTFLFDPEGGRDALTAALSPVLNGQDWVLHAAPSDLPCLAWMGLYPGTVFDTELAARLIGHSRPSLAHITEEFVGVHLDKGFGDADWSARPIPEEQLLYARQDVDLLLELADELRGHLVNDDKQSWAEEEFALIVAGHADITEPAPAEWRDLRGLPTLRSRRQLNVARALWNHRDEQARSTDTPPGWIMSNKVLLEVARQLPTTPHALGRIRGFPRRRHNATLEWMQVLDEAYALDPSWWPEFVRSRSPYPSKNTMSRTYPELWEKYKKLQEDIHALAAEIQVNDDVFITNSTVRHAVWSALATDEMIAENASLATDNMPDIVLINEPDNIPEFLRTQGAREWQIELATPVFAEFFFPA